MARLFTSGFELQSLTNGVEWDTYTATLSIDTTTKRSGAASLRANFASNGTGSIANRFRADATATFWVRFYLLVHTAPAAQTTIFQYGDGSYNPILVKLNTTRKVSIWDDGGLIGAESSALTADTWYRIEVSYNDTTNVTTLWVDGSQIATGGSSAVDGGGIFSLGSMTSTTCDIYFDDVAVNDAAAGGTQTGLPGDGGVIILSPNGDGDSESWTRGGTDSGANFSQCNNIPPNNHTSYVSTSTLNALDMYNCAASGIGASDTVNVVEVGYRYARSAATSPSIKARIVKTSGGTELLSAAVTPNNTQPTYKTNANAAPRRSPIISYADPDAGAWTQSTLNSMQIGFIETTDQTATVYVTSVWAMVDYTVSAAAGPTNLKSLNTNLKANVKSYNTNLIANIKSINTNV